MKKRTRESATPELTPLIDVVFLLLIFFMVSTVFKKDELALLLKLPTTKEGKQIDQKKIVNIYIELSADQIALSGKKVTMEELETKLDKVADKKTQIDYRIDQDVKYSRVVRVLEMLKKNKLNNISLITSKSSNEKK